jgi:hypothetical protein
MLQSREEEEELLETARRKPTYPIDSLFTNRWSPRSMIMKEREKNAKHSPIPCLRTGPYPQSHTLQQQHLLIWHY